MNRLRVMRLLGCGVLALALAGCANVRPYERELLADPLMASRYEDEGDMHDMKWMEAREGSTGGVGGAGGGGACR
jgi:hypothetical protein